MLLLLLAVACTRNEDDVVTPPAPLPWEGLAASDDTTGAFEVEIGETLPGVGWFHTGDDERWGAEGAFARVERPDGAKEDVLGITLVGRATDAGWTTLQLAVALSSWGEGALELDGESGVGVLRRHEDGIESVLAYVVGGELAVDEAGTEEGEVVAGEFEALTLREVTP